MKYNKNKRAARTWRKEKKRRFRICFRHADAGTKKRRRPVSKRAVLVLAAVAASSALAYGIVFSDVMRIKKITVKGTENIAAQDLESLVRSSLSGKKYGLIPGDSFLFQDLESLEAKTRENYAEIESVNVSLRFPDEMILEVREKNTALIWCRDICYFVNEAGIAFLPADEGELIKEQKYFIKIIEEAEVAEESEEERQEILERAMTDGAAGAEDAETEDIPGMEAAASVQDIEALIQEGSSILSAIRVNEKVADESFISFAVEIGGLLGHDPKIKIRYFKTKGYKTRELIGFTDQNTRLYFDTTKSAEKQAKNLDYLLSEGIEKEKIDALRYIYLKNEDRVFYR